MMFASLNYLLFLPIVFLVFRAMPSRWRWLVLLSASYLFYAMLKAPYLLAVLAAVTLVSYGGGRWLERETESPRRRLVFWTCTGAIVAILGFLKYLPLWGHLLQRYSSLTPNVVLVSIGVSYFTFQAISYLADIYLRMQKAERHLGLYALYLAFFPKLLQGPIERGGVLLPQLRQEFPFDYDAVRSGMLLFAYGLLKKVVIADRLSVYANHVYSNVHGFTGLSLILGTYAYALQLYYDFSGYTDMARGTGRIFGIELTENFRAPYLATSVADFWRRWHISFSRWILDYLFKPLQIGWRDWGQAGTVAALMVTFLISGIWHGGRWGFVVWGALHGLYLAAGVCYAPFKKRWHKRLGLAGSRWLELCQILLVFNLVSFSWIFFRAASIQDAFFVVRNLFNFSGEIFPVFLLSQGKANLIVIALSAIIVALGGTFSGAIAERLAARWPLRWSAYYCLVIYLVLMASRKTSNFIYFGF